MSRHSKSSLWESLLKQRSFPNNPHHFHLNLCHHSHLLTCLCHFILYLRPHSQPYFQHMIVINLVFPGAGANLEEAEPFTFHITFTFPLILTPLSLSAGANLEEAERPAAGGAAWASRLNGENVGAEQPDEVSGMQPSHQVNSGHHGGDAGNHGHHGGQWPLVIMVLKIWTEKLCREATWGALQLSHHVLLCWRSWSYFNSNVIINDAFWFRAIFI